MTILVADADPFNLRLLSELCEALGHDVASAGDGESVLDAVARQKPLLLIMDAGLPRTEGMEVLRVLKSDADLMQIPVIVAVADDEADTRRQALELGAVDYLSRPYRTYELQQRVRSVLRLQAARGVSAAAAGAGASRDSLNAQTGLGSTSQLHFSLDYEYTRAMRYDHPLSCVVVRCQNLGDIEGRMGAVAAESLMLPLAAALRTCVRGVDQLFRSGPDEFTILLPETAATGCGVVSERLNAQLAELFGEASDFDPRPLLVVGSASCPAQGLADGEALRRGASAAADEVD